MPTQRFSWTPLLKCAECAVSTSSASKPAVQPQDVIRDLHARDERDRNRADSPLKPAPDAVILDSTNLSLDEAVKAAEEIVAAKLADESLSDSRDK